MSENAPAAAPPERVVEAFRPVDPVNVVEPQPRYPDEPSSFISYVPPPEPGMVGSAFGLYV